MKVTRPLLRYHGGKWRIAETVISYFPPHKVYTEAFGGGGSVLLRKTPSTTEVYNDLCGDVVNAFTMMRDRGDELRRKLELTPFSRKEYKRCYQETADPLEAARRFIFRAHAGIGSDSARRNNGFRIGLCDGYISTAGSFAGLSETYPAIIARLRPVLIENRDASAVIKSFDTVHTLHYVDPPYPFETRKSKRRGYNFEMRPADHEALAELLHGVAGMVIVSGYECDLYSRLYSDWRQVTIAARDNVNNDRVECLWISPKCKPAQLELL